MKTIFIVIIVLILAVAIFTIASVWKRGFKALKNVNKIINKEKYTNCIATWPSKCFDCDAQMCSGQHKTNPALASSGLANLGRM